MRISAAVVVVLAVSACAKKKEQQAPPPAPAPPAVLPAGPAPVTLPTLEPAQLRTLTSASSGFLTIDAHGEVRWGSAAKPGYAGELLQRDDSAFAQLFPFPEDRGHEHHAIRAEGIVEGDHDAVAGLDDGPATEVLVLADAAVPARITLRHALTVFAKHGVALAASAPNTAVKYRFGAGDWPSYLAADAVFHADHLEPVGDRHPEHALLAITENTTTGDLVHALGVLGAAGVPIVRVHWSYTWSGLGTANEVAGPASDESVVRGAAFVDTTTLADPVVTGGLSAMGVVSALKADQARFRFCYEARANWKLHGTVKLAFDVAADGAVSHAKATGVDAKVADCVQKSVFDLDITPLAITGAGHVAVDIAYSPIDSPEPAPAPAPQGGYWCFIDGDVSLCAPLQEQCEAGRDGYMRAGTQFGQPTNASDCKHQKTAWTSNGTAFNATRKLCGKGCREVR